MSAARPHRHALADWRSVRVWEGDTRERLRRRHALWLHGWCIGLLVLLAMWGMAHLQMALGTGSLALRYLVTLGAGYLVFLLVLRWWAGWLVGEDGVGDLADPGGILDVLPDARVSLPRGCEPAGTLSQPLRSGGGGDFGGGGADGDFAISAGGVGEIGESGSAVGELASGAVEAAAASDEAAVVVVPVVVVFLVGLLVAFGAGSLLLLYFGSEVLLTVALELAFGYVSARTAVRLAREGWLGAAVRLTWKPLAGALACAVLLGLVIDVAVPQARSLPHAMQLLRGR